MLVVDDDTDARELVQFIREEEGAIVTSVASAIDCSKLSTIIPESAGALRLRGKIQPSDSSPILKALAHLFAIAFCGELMLFGMKVVSNRFKG